MGNSPGLEPEPTKPGAIDWYGENGKRNGGKRHDNRDQRASAVHWFAFGMVILVIIVIIVQLTSVTLLRRRLDDPLARDAYWAIRRGPVTAGDYQTALWPGRQLDLPQPTTSK